MNRKRDVCVSGVLLALLLAVLLAQVGLQNVSAQQAAPAAPVFQVDPMWPKPLPNHWILGSVIGIAVDSKDHIWIIHRPGSLTENEKAATLDPPAGECCVPAPPVLEFDQAGNLLRHWGGPGPGYEWPSSEHGIYVDHKDNVWVAGAGGKDSQVLKFTADGRFLLQIGHPGKSSGDGDTENFGKPTDITVDPTTNEAYVADGYGNHRVIVFDADTGAYKRMWGAYGRPPQGPPEPPLKLAPGGIVRAERHPDTQMQFVHCVVISKDNLVYVCDRLNDRYQVFKKDGTFVKETFLAKGTLGAGSVWDIDFSKDPQQKYMYVADGQNMKVHIVLRATDQVVGTIGSGGRQIGQFWGVHNLVLDSKGTLYTAETYEGKRVQRFVHKGLGAASE
jgi:DNA-binding beta-propeller fold protein YncE